MGAEEQGVEQSRHRYQVIPRVLVFVTNAGKLLLLKGAPDKRIWPNLYNGIGGHIERGEDVRAAALREVQEEVGLRDVENLRLRGIIHIDAGDPRTGIMLFVFTGVSQTTGVAPSAEGTPEWIEPDRLPKESLVPDLPALLSLLESMKPDDPPFFARYWYNEAGRLQMHFST